MAEQLLGDGAERFGRGLLALAAANQQIGEQQAHADHGAGQGQGEQATDEFAEQLAQKNAGESGGHDGTPGRAGQGGERPL